MRIHIAYEQADFFQIMRIRRDVFMIGQHVCPSIEQDELDDNAIHIIGCTDDNIPIATCRLIEKNDCYTLGRLAVLEPYRNTGVGSMILAFAEVISPVQTKGRIRLHAQTSAFDFYRKNGYSPIGKPFWEAGIEHIEMEKKLFEEEYKTLVTKEQFEALKQILNAPEPIKQTNHYYSASTEGKYHSSIRVRERNDEVIFTLKVVTPEGLQEHEKILSTFDFTKDPYVMHILEENNLLGPYHNWGSLETYRSQIDIMDSNVVLAELCFDHNIYLNNSDYEIEYEVQSKHNALEKFKEILSLANIPYIENNISKVKRCKSSMLQ